MATEESTHEPALDIDSTDALATDVVSAAVAEAGYQLAPTA